MARNINPTVETILTSDQSRLCYLVSLDFDTDGGILRVNNTGVNLLWDGNIYIGLGQLGSVALIEESTELQTYTVSFSLYTQDTGMLAKALGSNYVGKSAFLWVAALDENYNIEEDSSGNGPLLIFAGKMWNMEMSFGRESLISIIATSSLADWENAHGGRYNQGTQMSRVDEFDEGFDLVTVIPNQEIWWGNKPIVSYSKGPLLGDDDEGWTMPPGAHSDIRLKTDITSEFILNGNQWYSFNYIWGGPRYLGVMAQEIIETNPDAVSIGSDGYYRVNYAKL